MLTTPEPALGTSPQIRRGCALGPKSHGNASAPVCLQKGRHPVKRNENHSSKCFCVKPVKVNDYSLRKKIAGEAFLLIGNRFPRRFALRATEQICVYIYTYVQH